MMLSLLPLWSLVCGLASAGPGLGIVVRFDSDGPLLSDAPVVVLTPTEGGAPIRVELNDAGQQPDVSADDGIWAGTAPSNARSVQVSVELNGEVIDAGTVMWADGDSARDLVVSHGWSGVQASAVVSTGASPEEAAVKSPAGRSDKSSESKRARRSSTPVTSPSAPRDLTPWLPVGAGVLMMLLGFGLAIRNSRPPLRPMRIPRLAEPPMLGPGTPALHRGLSRWRVEPSDRDVVVAALVQTMARAHRVLLVIPDSLPLPEASGGPVYVLHDTSRAAVEDHLIDLFDRPGLPVTVLFVMEGASPAEASALADILEPDVGGVLVFSASDGSFPSDIVVARSDSGLRLMTGVREIDVRVSDAGMVLG